ncbi:39S ribosomal protein L18, mitochondrial-like [Dendronephthya gigantea]|uniref:39S ribosomal protein L18, mitochondrial-like n=1 Tax=Dendronephthya gigantea TaxID=151771 RepID=UPI00106C5B3C|nr:39S ribosomal protein L18, mitochondrial-like [Dendronephthya gigantea]
MAAKNVQILVNRYFDIFRRSLWVKSSQNRCFTRFISTPSFSVATAREQKQFNDEIYPDLTQNSSIPLETFVNRNPKNPEYFGYNKQRGYSTQYKKRNFFKRLNLVLSNRHVKAYVEDQNGDVLVKASTEEFDVRRHLYKANDVSAAANIGRVLAERCLRAGLNQVSMYTTDIRKKEKYKEFRKAMTAGGIKLTEPARVVPLQTFYTGISVRKKRKGIIGMKINNSTKRKFT